MDGSGSAVGAAVPLIAVTGRRRSARGLHGGPSTLDALTLDVYFAGYAEHIAAAGGLPLHVPAAVEPASVIDRVDALVLTGGTDVDPARYGAPVHATTQPTEPDRDDLEVTLLAAALARGLPVLAICRGLQLVNVARGGTLHAHLAEHPAGGRHDVIVATGSTLHRLHGPRTSVNSLHHQGIDRAGAGVVVTARAPDDVVEGIELDGARLLGVQWHPEQMDPRPQPVFRWLVDEARRTV